MTVPVTDPVADTVGDDDYDDLVHRTCDCEPDLTLCGRWLDPDSPYADGAVDNLCVVCEDLDAFPCERCGE